MTDTRKTWRIKSARTVYTNKWIAVREYQTVAPTGADALYGLVHMHNRCARQCCRSTRRAVRSWWGRSGFRSGGIRGSCRRAAGQRAAAAGGRAAGAVGGVRAEGGALAAAGGRTCSLSNSVTDERAYAFIAWGLSPDDSFAKDSSEELSVRRVPFAEAVKMAVSGEITDAFTLVMLLKADHLLRTGALPQEPRKAMLQA